MTLTPPLGVLDVRVFLSSLMNMGRPKIINNTLKN